MHLIVQNCLWSVGTCSQTAWVEPADVHAMQLRISRRVVDREIRAEIVQEDFFHQRQCARNQTNETGPLFRPRAGIHSSNTAHKRRIPGALCEYLSQALIGAGKEVS